MAPWGGASDSSAGGAPLAHPASEPWQYDRAVPTLRGIDDRQLPVGAWLHERLGVLLRMLRVRADPIILPPPPQVDLILGARSAAKAASTLHIDPDYAFHSYEERRALYTDFLTGFLLPRTTIWSGDRLMIEVNSLGCRGGEIEQDKPVIGFFGDSTTLGVMGTAEGLVSETWTERLDLPSYAVLNAGVEGIEMGRVGRRYRSLRNRVPLVCAVFYTGWHNLIYNQRTPDYWEECLQSYLSPTHKTVLCTLPTPLLPEMRERGIEELENEHPDATISDRYFHFWGDWDRTRWLVELIDAHERFNGHLADFCVRTGTPLIDLDALFRPPSYEEATRDFFDVCHLRPHAYPKLAAFVSDELRAILPVPPPSVNGWRPQTEVVEPEPAEDLRRNIYPVW